MRYSDRRIGQTSAEDCLVWSENGQMVACDNEMGHGREKRAKGKEGEKRVEGTPVPMEEREVRQVWLDPSQREINQHRLTIP